jgi:hypothetical protein
MTTNKTKRERGGRPLRRLLFSKMVYAQNGQRQNTSNADPKNHTLFSALSGLKMGSTSTCPAAGASK